MLLFFRIFYFNRILTRIVQKFLTGRTLLKNVEFKQIFVGKMSGFLPLCECLFSADPYVMLKGTHFAVDRCSVCL